MSAHGPPTHPPVVGRRPPAGQGRQRHGSPRRQHGAALLLAMVILTIVATLAAGMSWQQWRALEAEAAGRARSQAGWILSGALDWARLILREDARTGGADHLGEPWAVPLAEARLSTFLAAARGDGAATDTDGGVFDAFLSGRIEDAQARYNLRNLIDGEQVLPGERAVLQRLFVQAGSNAGAADALADALRRAWSAGEAAEGTPLAPDRVAHLVWLGVDPALVRRLEAWTVILPTRTPVNINTAAAGVLLAVVPGLESGSARQIVEQRSRQPFATLDQAAALLPRDAEGRLPSGLSVASGHFEVTGRLRLDGRLVEERSLVERRQLEVTVLRREPVAAGAGTKDW